MSCRPVLPPRPPKLNGGVERCNQTWRYAFYGGVELPTSINDIAREVDRFQHKYNDLRPHGALAYDTPAEYLSARRTTETSPSHMC